jgi:excisionase family DNA binding protein
MTIPALLPDGGSVTLTFDDAALDSLAALIERRRAVRQAERAEREQWMSRAEFAQHLRVSRRTLTRWQRAGLPHARIGGAVKIDAAAATTWLKQFQRGAAVA